MTSLLGENAGLEALYVNDSRLTDDTIENLDVLTSMSTPLIKVSNIEEETSGGNINLKHNTIVLAGKTISSDVISETTVGSGVTVDGVILKDSEITTDKLNLGGSHTIEVDVSNNLVMDIPVGEEYKFNINGNTYLSVNETGLVQLNGCRFVYDDASFQIDQDNTFANTVFSFADQYTLKIEKPDADTALISSYKNSLRINAVTDIQFEVGAVDYATLTTGGLKVDNINELTTDAGVTIEGILFKDNIISSTTTLNISSAINLDATTNANITLNRPTITTTQAMIRFETTGVLRWAIGLDDNPASNDFQIYNATTTDYPFRILPTSGDVEIKNTLHVSDISFDSGLSLYNETLSTDSIRINTDGAVFLYQAVDDTIGDVAAYFNSTSGQIGQISSIRRSKIEITDFNNSFIYDMNPQKFYYRERNKDSVTGQMLYGDKKIGDQEYGLIAEDVEKINPNMCTYRRCKIHKSECKDKGKSYHFSKCKCVDSKELMGVNYNKFIAPLIKCVQEQRKEINKLMIEISDLRIKVLKTLSN
ncbi:MAG: hypothetical protein GWP19_00265 [Planctomycetia bacterium]|nr:hypothetical protein [Planctomycetia bacterium]